VPKCQNLELLNGAFYHFFIVERVFISLKTFIGINLAFKIAKSMNCTIREQIIVLVRSLSELGYRNLLICRMSKPKIESKNNRYWAPICKIIYFHRQIKSISTPTLKKILLSRLIQ
jgi:hypothetical protein